MTSVFSYPWYLLILTAVKHYLYVVINCQCKFCLLFPPQDFKVDNRILLDWINEDFSVKTVVAYSEDHRKTLTMFSALKNLQNENVHSDVGISLFSFFDRAVASVSQGYNYRLVNIT